MKRLRRANIDSRVAMGCEIILDDFGTGLSSLSLLKELPVSGLKVDQSFDAGVQWSRSDRQIVQSVVSLAKDLGLLCIVEGGEADEKATILKGLGPVHGQGFFWGRPGEVSLGCPARATAKKRGV